MFLSKCMASINRIMSKSQVLTFSLMILLISQILMTSDGLSDCLKEKKSKDNDSMIYSKEIENPVYSVPLANVDDFYFSEPFESEETFENRWILSQAVSDKSQTTVPDKRTNLSPTPKYDGVWRIEEMERNSLYGDRGLVLKKRAVHYAISANLNKPFRFNGQPFIVQYEVKFQKVLECGGAYIKLLTHDDNNLDLVNFNDETPYTIMFGPDKCGSDEKIHFIFRHLNPISRQFEEKHSHQPSTSFSYIFADKKVHLFTLAVYPNNTFEIYIDEMIVNCGSLLEDVHPPVNPSKEIYDPNEKKPKNWDDREKIPDLNAKRPNDWNEDEPEFIPDESIRKPRGWLDDEDKLIANQTAVKPSDWDDSIDGEWEPPLIDNPKCDLSPGCGKWSPPVVRNPRYKGKWSPPMIDNPNYEGRWMPKMIPNPNYFEDRDPYKMSPIGALGLEHWSRTNDIYFDNFMITDDATVAKRWSRDGWRQKRAQEISNTKGIKGWLIYFWDRGMERRWLFGLYAFLVLLPFVLLSVFLCPETGLLFKASDVMRLIEAEREKEKEKEKSTKKSKKRRNKSEERKSDSESEEITKEDHEEEHSYDDDKEAADDGCVTGEEVDRNKVNNSVHRRLKEKNA